MKKILQIGVVALTILLGACGGGGDDPVTSSSTSAALPGNSVPESTPQDQPDVLDLGEWRMACRNGFEFPNGLLMSHPAWLLTYGYRVSFTIDKRLDADSAEATVRFSKINSTHCDTADAPVLGEVIRTYHVRRVGQVDVQGQVAEQIEATLMSQQLTGAANVALEFCAATLEFPDHLSACELQKLPKVGKTILALTNEGLLAGFHLRGMQPDAGDRPSYETAAGYESSFDPFVIYRRVTN